MNTEQETEKQTEREAEKNPREGASAEQKVREYIAFISYRHKDLDKFVARKLHTLIERYVIPRELRKSGLHGVESTDADGKKNSSKHLGLVFRDEEELPVSSNLTQSIQTALDNAKYLIVVCTPNTPESIWVEREISYFLQKHDRSHVIGVLVDGTPDESFPKLLTTVYANDGVTPIGTVEPLAANLTDNAHHFDKRRIKKEVVRLYAALLGCPFDTLWQRDKRYKMRCAMALMALVMTIACAFCVSIYLKNVEITARNVQIEEQNAQIQAQNEEIKSQYDEIQDKNAELRRNEAETLIREGELLYEKGDTTQAAARALRAISSKEGREEFSADAEYLLNRSLGAGQYDNVFRTVGVIEQDREIRDLLVSNDNTQFFSLDDRGAVKCYSSVDGRLLWNGDSTGNTYHGYVADRPRMVDLEDLGFLLCLNEDGIAALRKDDGSTAWKFDMDDSDEADFAILSKDQKLLAVIVGGDILNKVNKLVILRTEDGAVQQEIAMDEYDGSLMSANGRVNGVFSEDGRYLAGMVYEKQFLYYGYDAYSIFLVDLQKGTLHKLTEEAIEAENFSVKPFVIGVSLNPEAKTVLALHYDIDSQSVQMERVTWSGQSTVLSEVPMMLPARELTGPYHSFFLPGEKNGVIWAGCQEMSLLYNKENGELISSKKYSNNSILHQCWLDEEIYTRSMLAEDGTQYAFYENAGYAIGEFTDKIHITRLAVSNNYAENHGDFGHTLDKNAVALLMCDDNLRRFYLQKPAKDENVEEVDWGNKQEDYQGVVKEILVPLRDNMLMHAISKNTSAKLQLVDAASQEVLWEGSFTDDEMPSSLNASELLTGVFWQNGQCVSRILGVRRLGYFDLKERKLTPVFDGEILCETGLRTLSDGSFLHAAIAVSNTKKEYDLTGKILLQIEDGEMKEIENTTGKNWISLVDWIRYSSLWTGENGYVLVGQYAVDQENNCMDSFYFYKLGDGSNGEITDECPMTRERLLVMGKKKPLFVTADEDGYLRVYDMTKKAVAAKMALPVDCDEVQDILFCGEDRAVAIWTKSRGLSIYEIPEDGTSWKLLYQGGFDKEHTEATFEVNVTSIEDPERNRVYFMTSRSAVICIDTRFWKKVADFNGMDAFCKGTNEIYRIKMYSLSFHEETEGILRCRAYTLEDLKALHN